MYASVLNEDAGERKLSAVIILSVLCKLASFRIARDSTTVTVLGVSPDPEAII